MSSEKELCGESILYIAACYAEVLADDITKSVWKLRFAAIKELHASLITLVTACKGNKWLLK